MRRYALVSILLLSIVVNLLSSTASYAKTYNNMTPMEQMKSWLYYGALSDCIQNRALKDGRFVLSPNDGGNKISEEHATSGMYFFTSQHGERDSNPSIGYFLRGPGTDVSIETNDNDAYDNEGARVLCDDAGGWVLDAASLWGYGTSGVDAGIDLLCDIGGVRANTSDCRDGSGEFTSDDGSSSLNIDSFRDVIKKRIYGGSDPTRGDPAYYLHARNAFFMGCLGTATPTAYTGTATDDFLYTNVKVVNPDPQEGDEGVETLKFYGVKKSTDRIEWSVSPAGVNQSATCAEIAGIMNDKAGDYEKYVSYKVDTTGTGDTGAGETPPGNDGQTAPPACAISGVGWIICPVLTFMGELADNAFTFVANNFLQVDPGTVASGSDSGTFKAWTVMRNLANVAFVIAFLIITFSQITGQGVANYGIKKMLPRLIIAAILVNVSYYICQLAVDLSNILGWSINNLFSIAGADLTITEATAATDQSGLWTGIIAGVVGGASIAYALGLSVLIPFLLTALVSVVMTMIILVIRQVAIVLLVVIAPIAFVAYLLPNTEQWFTKWRKMFVGLLLVFPVVGLLFGAGALASDVLTTVWTPDTSDPDTSTEVIGQIIAHSAAVLPLLFLPTLLKGSLNSLGSIGGKISGIGDKFSKQAGGKFANSGLNKQWEQRRAIKKARVGAGIYEGRNPVSRMRSSLNNKLNSSGTFNAVTGGYGTARGAMIGKLEDEEIKTEEAAIALKARASKGPGDDFSVRSQFKKALERGDVVAATAAQNILMSKGGPGVKDVRDVLQKVHAAGQLSGDMRSAIASNTLNSHAVAAKQKSPDLLTWAAGNGSKGLDDVSADPATWEKLTASDLAGVNDDAFEKAIQSNGVSINTISALKDPRRADQLTDIKRAALGITIRKRPPAPGAPPTTGAPNAGTPPNTGGPAPTNPTTPAGP